MSSKIKNIKLTQVVLAEIVGVNRASLARRAAALHVLPVPESTERYKAYDITGIRKILSSYFRKNPIHITDKIQVFYNFKGGTGKTSICYQTAALLAMMGFQVLAIDMDPQAHLSSLLWFEEGHRNGTMYDTLVGGVPLDDCITEVFEGLHAIPSNLSLTKLESMLITKTKRESLLKKVLSEVRDRYDFIFIDTNPAISISNINALVAADQVNIVTETQPFSLAGLGILVEENEKVSREMEMAFHFRIIANKYEAKTITSQEVLGALRLDYREAMMKTVVRKNEDINVASKKSLPVCVFAKRKTPAFEDILDLTKEVLRLPILSQDQDAA